MSLPRYAAQLEDLTVFAADGQAVMFDPRDGGLHLLAELPWAVMVALQQRPADAEALKQALHAEYPEDDVDEQRAAIDEALSQLQALGLIQAAAS